MGVRPLTYRIALYGALAIAAAVAVCWSLFPAELSAAGLQVEVSSADMVRLREEGGELPQETASAADLPVSSGTHLLKQDRSLVALKVPGGFLAGTDHGEFGGRLVFVDDRGIPTDLLRDNIEIILKAGDGYIAAGGVSHLGIIEGKMYKVHRSEAGVWTSAHWKDLPANPSKGWIAADGSLYVYSWIPKAPEDMSGYGFNSGVKYSVE